MMSLSFVLSFLCLALKTSSDTIPASCQPGYDSFPFCNTSLPINDRVNNLISLLTIEEKSKLLIARESPLNFIPRLGIAEYDWGANCIHGVESRCGSHCPTSFPNPNALGSSWNKSLIWNITSQMGLELRALWLEGMGENRQSNLPHIGLNCWAPTINIGRDPRWGRMREIPSEDPLWNGVYGTYFTLGLQNGSEDNKWFDPRYYLGIATLKHFDAYSMEDYEGITRNSFNAKVSPYMLADTYMPAFQMAIEKGGAKGVMCALRRNIPGWFMARRVLGYEMEKV